MKIIKGTLKKIIYNIEGKKLKKAIDKKRKASGDLVLLISSPYYGNVGDHAILLAEKSLIEQAGYGDKIVDITSVEYQKYNKQIKKAVKAEDLIVIDGGGNFGDVWQETQEQLNNIVLSFPNNKIIVFPESWYFTDSEKGKALLKKVSEVFSGHKNLTLFARDSFSYREMKKHIELENIFMALDCVFSLPLDKSEKGGKGVALIIREDKEAFSKEFTKEKFVNALDEKGIAHFDIYNDCYLHIAKEKRQEYVYNIIEQYKDCDLVITDRFHGLVISIICNKPCVILDNKTGKVGNFYNDVKEEIDGIKYIIEGKDDINDILEFILGQPKLVVKKEFLCRLQRDKNLLIDQIKKLKEEKR